MSGPMKIMQVADLYEPFIGGMETHVRALAGRLARRGHEVTVVTARLPGTAAHQSAGGVTVRRISGWSARALAHWYEQAGSPFHPPVPDPGVVAQLRSIIREIRPDVISAQGWAAYSCLAIPGRRPPLTVTVHDHGYGCARKTLLLSGHTMCPGPQLGRCLRCAPGQYGLAKGTALTVGLRGARVLHARADAWVAVSRYVADASRCLLPGDREVTVIPPLSPQPPDPGSRPGWLPAGGYFLFVGALGRHKGLHWLLDAYAGGGFRRPLVVLGTPRRDTPRSWPAGVVVRTSVPHRQVMEAWRYATAGLVPSLCPEPFGLVAVEGMRAGVPLVASRIGALPEIVSDGVTGLLVQPADTAQLRAAMRSLDGNPALRRRLGEAGAARAERFGPELVTGRYEQHFRRLAAGDPAASRPSPLSAGRSPQ